MFLSGQAARLNGTPELRAFSKAILTLLVAPTSPSLASFVNWRALIPGVLLSSLLRGCIFEERLYSDRFHLDSS